MEGLPTEITENGIDQMEWVRRMNSIRQRAEEVISSHCFNDGNKRATEALVNYLKKCE